MFKFETEGKWLFHEAESRKRSLRQRNKTYLRLENLNGKQHLKSHLTQNVLWNIKKKKTFIQLKIPGPDWVWLFHTKLFRFSYSRLKKIKYKRSVYKMSCSVKKMCRKPLFMGGKHLRYTIRLFLISFQTKNNFIFTHRT